MQVPTHASSRCDEGRRDQLDSIPDWELSSTRLALAPHQVKSCHGTVVHREIVVALVHGTGHFSQGERPSIGLQRNRQRGGFLGGFIPGSIVKALKQFYQHEKKDGVKKRPARGSAGPKKGVWGKRMQER